MEYILGSDINIAFILVVLFALTLVGGIFKWPFFICAAIFLLSYIILDKKRLRCPNCGGFENLMRLDYAKNHVCHCTHCGEKINILN